ncbi:MAG: quinolinate synthase NadA [Candidatus Edwardsbacteria bacterium]|nr:quinolinate synthase NadA [Candidatus Edwardsbacteria bacterium]MBU1577433.1 quinolinate synthase NadA [Candidatus Edwardsbacteria bacterium]MBU2463233.1 quinolinate synthase NadA [Candidatus Edwardsbacteria bacterium]MBU2593000.1 quinolinate synthase NadA [Candidatus Edwardsbacteria bacterium]
MTLEEYQRLSDDELYKKISRLKEERDAVFLVHNYQVLPVQRLADFIGDSLALAQAAVKVKAGTIVFCGVHFMAESAKLLNPEKTVLLPDRGAGCPMADMVTPEALRQARKKYNDPIVVTYVNSSAAVKAESDICCTSSNAVDIINSLPADREILFVPDRNLGSYAAKKTGRKLILWPGYCYVHNRFTVQDIINAREEHPGATVIVHPECPPEVIEQADMAASTSGMVQEVKEHPEIDQWVIGTEDGLVEQLSAANPQKGIYPLAANAVCRNMKMITLAKAAWALENQKYEITVPAEVAERARLALERMLEVSGRK